MMTYQNLSGRANEYTPAHGYDNRNWKGVTRKSGSKAVRVRQFIYARDGYVCQKCGKDCRAEYAEYLAGVEAARVNKTPRPHAVVVAAHLVSFKDNGLNGLNVEYGMVNGIPTVFVNDDATRKDLRSCGFSDADIEATMDTATYRADYDPNNMEAWCRLCNEQEADAIGHGRGVEVLLSKEEVLKRIARAYALNKAAGWGK